MIVNEINGFDIMNWSKVLESRPSNIYNFAQKALLQTLPTAANLYKWSKITDSNCALCKANIKQTNKHVLSNCPSQTALTRYLNRHNEVLRLITRWLEKYT